MRETTPPNWALHHDLHGRCQPLPDWMAAALPARSLRLPSEYGVDDIPLILQDRRFNSDGSFDYLSAMPDAMMGYKGNVILVNGTANPHIVLRRQRTRLR